MQNAKGFIGLCLLLFGAGMTIGAVLGNVSNILWIGIAGAVILIAGACISLTVPKQQKAIGK